MFISRNPQAVAFRRALGPAATGATIAANGRSAMRSKDLMSPDLLSEIVLLGSGTLVLVSLLLFVVTAFTRA
jgi:hypothetical protein